ncbi:retrovirus-related pol polyprotein from transposon TNT 1-94 [Tanacetum coccineum]|uniref:Retrovirus-related pol polyprotein from transposon TNT 1-94 n=1 Tax=Tanacetum coccineum TaxID=301880 RepID=A0ABQ5AVN0_9ASTR
MGKNTGQKEIRPVWNSVQRINHQNKFVPSAVLTRPERVPVSAAKQSSFRAAASTGAVKQVNTATHTNRVNVSKLRTNAFHKSHSPIRSTVKGNEVTAVKASAGCVWRPKMTNLNNVSKENSGSWGNSQQALKNKGIFNSGCSRHMTGNKDFLTDYQELDGGFVAFGGSDRDGENHFKLKHLYPFFKTEAHIEQILPHPSTYQRHRKTQNRRRTKKDTKLPQTSVPQDLGADEAVHTEGVTVWKGLSLLWQSQAPRNHGGTPAQTRSERVLEKPNEPPLSEGHTSGSGKGRMEHQFELTANVPLTPHDSPLPGGYTPGSDEGRLQLQELMTMCTKLSKQVLDLEKEKDAQTFESSDDDLDEEDASKQGRGSDKIKPILCNFTLCLWKLEAEEENIRAERIVKSAIPLDSIAAAQPYSDNYYQAPKPQRSNATSSSTRPSASTRHKGKEIAKPITPQSESVSVSDEDSDPEQAQRDKEMQKNLALLAKYFKKLYKPTNNNLRTSSNSRNKTEDTTPRYNNDNQSRQFGNQRTMTVAGARETVGSQVVQQTGIQCFNCKGYGHYAKECRKPKRVKDYAYHKEKMMMCKQAEQGVPLQAEQADWLEDTDEEIDEQELEAHYSYMAKIQDVSPEGTSSTGQPLEQVQNQNESNVYDNVRRHSEQPESINDTYVLEKDDSNVTPDSSNICTNDNQVDQNAAECVDERAALANLIANLTLDTEENKTILKQLKKATHHYSEMGKNKQNEFEKYKAFNDRTIDYEILQTKLNETLGLLALKGHWITGEKDIDKMIGNGQTVKVFELNCLYSVSVNRTIHMLAPKCSRHNNGRPTFANPRYLKKAQSEKPCLYEIPFDTSDPANRFAPEREETTTLDNESRSKLNKDYVKPYDYTKQNSLYEIYYKATLNWRYLISWKTRKGS